jgi:hypothetical protein
MFNDFLMNPVVRSLLCVALTVIALMIAMVISSGVRLNKGAGVNGPLVLLAIGFVVDAVSAALAALGYFGSTTLGAWCPVIGILAQAIKLSGLAWWRAVLKGLAK